ncbi:MAG: hypothetical protein ACLFNZ_09820 [Spirochaetaceae bacterium]
MEEKKSDTETFLAALEEQNGGPLEWRTYAFLLGASGDNNPRSLGGLLYVAADTLIFEDFERENALLGLLGKRKKYEKCKIEASLSSVAELRSVAAGEARRAINGKCEPNTLPVLSGIRKILEKRTEAVIFKDGTAWFFEMYDTEGLKKILKAELP